ncbi:GEVED domain-containing protein [Adhaeribacter radiodurans]|uniref:T9SS type A sorting domain-containing protein n=1 Tax=Adhaeribacter radiodurans TaxID=2745197 RepID=A0A7L7L6M3_9BACT|nr:GEVED domain-containing protein [Adhaeribacter radiodurans]QMU28165.1 T9SS type A sorting domain-containing protein [Adhaeribacter radiodurans]
MKIFTKLLIFSFCWLSWTTVVQAQTQINLGKATNLVAVYKANASSKATNAATTGKKIRQTVPGRVALVLRINLSKKEGTTEEFIGSVDGHENGSFFMQFDGNNLSGFIILKDQKKAYQYSSDAKGQAYLQEVDINKVICVEYKKSSGIKSQTSNQVATTTAAAVPLLESYPGANAVILLDFDGQYVSGTSWNGRGPINAAPSNLTTAQMVEVWNVMSEDFRPYALNITTNEAVFNSTPKNLRMRVIFTPTDAAYPGVGGVAYLGSLNWNDDTPCWVFINDNGKFAGECGSHEVGHTLKLMHDGKMNVGYYSGQEYYEGQANWAPIMGISYTKRQTQWSKGEYPSANNTEDDLAIMATNGFGFRIDEATRNLARDASGNIIASSNYGVISTRADEDIFSFTIAASTVTLNVKPNNYHPNLDIKLTLKNSASTILASSDPADMSASITTELGAGTYYLHIDGATGAMGANSDYASLGEYYVSGTIKATYCIPTYTVGCSPTPVLVNNFSFNTLVNNNSGCSTGTVKGYTNYLPTGTFTTSVNRGQSYRMNLQAAGNLQYFGVWIDYNNDGDFADAGEFVYVSPTRSMTLFSPTITIPATAALGKTRMRVRSNYDAPLTGNHSCSSMIYGEAEDYTITIAAPATLAARITNNQPQVEEYKKQGTIFRSYPNPFTNKSTIEFDFDQEQEYEVRIYNATGSIVRALPIGQAKANTLVQVEWADKKIPTGVYLVQLRSRKGVQTLRLIRE